MKKTIGTFVAISAVFSNLIASPVVYENDFEDAAVGQPPSGWSRGEIKAGNVGGNTTQYFQGVSASKSGVAPSIAQTHFSEVQGPISIEFRLLELKVKSFSTLMIVYSGGKSAFRMSTGGGKLHVDTLMNFGRAPFARFFNKTAPGWKKVRVELNPGKESENCQIFIDGKPKAILSAPGLYTTSFDGISFGWMAGIDDLKIISGESALTPIENAEKYIYVNPIQVTERSADHKLPNGKDPYVLFLQDGVPKVVKTISDKIEGELQVTELVLEVRPESKEYGLIESHVHAIIARPASANKPLPGILILHGGGGWASAEKAKVLGWASRGYMAMAIDVPGVCQPNKVQHSTGVARLPYAANRWNASPDAATSSLFDAQLAGLQALNFLRAQPKINKDKIGLTGISWGGFTSTGVAGLAGDKLHAVFAVYGCGFLDLTGMSQFINKASPEDKARWFKYIDAGRKAPGITAPYFIAAPTNDGHFHPPAVSATLDAIPGEKNQLINPNENHRCNLVPGGTKKKDNTTWLSMEIPYFAYHLKGEGKPFPSIIVSDKKSDQERRVFFSLEGPEKFDTPEVYCTVENELKWGSRKWLPVEVKVEGKSRFSALLPKNAADLHWFAMVSDVRDITVSSQMQLLKGNK